ncbi:MAG: hypothetical protein ACK5GN_07050, partial [Pseudomonadota bacterium]
HFYQQLDSLFLQLEFFCLLRRNLATPRLRSPCYCERFFSKITRAGFILLLDAGKSSESIAEYLFLSGNTVTIVAEFRRSQLGPQKKERRGYLRSLFPN